MGDIDKIKLFIEDFVTTCDRENVSLMVKVTKIGELIERKRVPKHYNKAIENTFITLCYDQDKRLDGFLLTDDIYKLISPETLFLTYAYLTYKKHPYWASLILNQLFITTLI